MQVTANNKLEGILASCSCADITPKSKTYNIYWSTKVLYWDGLNYIVNISKPWIESARKMHKFRIVGWGARGHRDRAKRTDTEGVNLWALCRVVYIGVQLYIVVSFFIFFEKEILFWNCKSFFLLFFYVGFNTVTNVS